MASVPWPGLIAKGADVNQVDGNGMTPLLDAASIDFGSPAMVDMLLKAGARADMKTSLNTMHGLARLSGFLGVALSLSILSFLPDSISTRRYLAAAWCPPIRRAWP